METRFKIEFGDHRHRRTGFLSNASRYPFVLDNKEWLSVEHYVYAQPFKGSPLEEQLRCAPSFWHLQFLIRGKRMSCEKNGRVVKTYEKPVASRDIYREYQKAIPNKFFQNQIIMERLLNTGNSRLIDVTCPYTGGILEQIRTQCYKERFQKKFMHSKQELETSPDIRDLLNSSLTVEDYSIINGLINKAWENMKKKGQNCIYVEFLENILLELYPKRAEFIIMLYQMRNPKIISQMHNFSIIINQVHEIFQKRDPYQVYDLSGSYLISEVLRWHKMYASPDEAAQFLCIVAPNFIKPSSEELLSTSYSSLLLDTPTTYVSAPAEDITSRGEPSPASLTSQPSPPAVEIAPRGEASPASLISQPSPPAVEIAPRAEPSLTSQPSPPAVEIAPRGEPSPASQPSPPAVEIAPRAEPSLTSLTSQPAATVEIAPRGEPSPASLTSQPSPPVEIAPRGEASPASQPSPPVESIPRGEASLTSQLSPAVESIPQPELTEIINVLEPAEHNPSN